MRRDSELRRLIHVVRTYLNLQGLTLRPYHCGMKRLVHVELGHGYVVFEATRQWFPQCVDDAQGPITVLDGGDEQSEGGQIIDLIELLALASCLLYTSEAADDLLCVDL